MTKVMFVGDSHGDASYMANTLKSARQLEVNTVIQLGDFSLSFDKGMIHSITAWLEQDENRKFYWIDGNHDHHDFLDELVDGPAHAPINMGGITSPCFKQTFPDRLFYIPRGAVFKIGDKTLMGLGGAYSIDQDDRKQGVDWWPQETISYANMHNAVINAQRYGPIDIMVTHDMPIIAEFEKELFRVGYKHGHGSYANRMNLSRVIDEVRPQSLYHGHYHYRHDSVYTTKDGWDVKVHGVAANVSSRGWIRHDAIFNETFIVREL